MKKRKRVEAAEVPREPVPKTEHEEDIHSEERGGFNASSEQPVLSPTKDDTIAPTSIRVENRGKQELKLKRATILSC